jgi:hypothetical protein
MGTRARGTVALVCLCLMAGCRGDGGPAGVNGRPTPMIPSGASSAGPTAMTPPAVSVEQALPIEAGPLPDGVYRSDPLSPRAVFRLEAGWEATRVDADSVDLRREGIRLVFARPDAVFGPDRVPVDDLLAARVIIALAPNRALDLGAAAATDVGGVPGFRLTIDPIGGQGVEVFEVEGGTFRLEPGEESVFWILNSQPGPFVIATAGREEDLDAFLPIIERLIAGLEFDSDR